jgi:hypothetical protein
VKRFSLVAVALVAVIAWVVHAFLGVNFWLAFAFGTAGILLNVVVNSLRKPPNDAP